MIDKNLKYKDETYNIKGTLNLIVLVLFISLFFLMGNTPFIYVAILDIVISILIVIKEHFNVKKA